MTSTVPSTTLMAVSTSIAYDGPEMPAAYCSASYKLATRAVATGPDADTYITTASKIVGAKPDEALAATKVIPFVSASDQTVLLAKGGELEKAYALTGQFLVDQGRTKTAPSAQITSNVDGSYAAQALTDGCDK